MKHKREKERTKEKEHNNFPSNKSLLVKRQPRIIYNKIPLSTHKEPCEIKEEVKSLGKGFKVPHGILHHYICQLLHTLLGWHNLVSNTKLSPNFCKVFEHKDLEKLNWEHI